MTTTISHAAAQASNLANGSAQVAQAAGGQTAQLSQVASQQDPERISDDKSRGVQDPKRTEASFATPEDKEGQASNQVKQKLRRNSGRGGNLDLVV